MDSILRLILIVSIITLIFATKISSTNKNQQQGVDPEEAYVDALEEYRQHLWVRNMQYTTYFQTLLGQHKRKQKWAAYKSALALTTPQPILNPKNLFFESGSPAAAADANYVSLTEVFSRPRTVDDDIGMPLNAPVNKEKISYNRYYPYYNYYGRK